MKSVVRACLLMSFVVPMSATTARRMNNRDLAAEAEVIVSGPRHPQAGRSGRPGAGFSEAVLQRRPKALGLVLPRRHTS